MTGSVEARVTIARDDLVRNARLIEARASDPDAELARLMLVRRFIAASFELTRTLRTQTQCALVNHCGTAGMRSLAEATEALYDALAEYAARCREVAAEAGTGKTYLPVTRRVAVPAGCPGDAGPLTVHSQAFVEVLDG